MQFRVTGRQVCIKNHSRDHGERASVEESLPDLGRDDHSFREDMTEQFKQEEGGRKDIFSLRNVTQVSEAERA